MLYECKLFAEMAQGRVDLWPYEALEFIDDLKRFKIDRGEEIDGLFLNENFMSSLDSRAC